jgi:GntR family transcriptional regulator
VTSATVDRSSSVPLYRQLEQILRRELAHAGPQGLTEIGLTERFGVSRYTVRQALDVLRREGLIDRQKKRGTFPVSAPLIQQPLEGIYSFGRSMSGLGLAPDSRVLSLRTIQPDESLSGKLELASPAVRLVELARLRSAAGEPMVLETIWLPEGLVPGIQHVDLTGSVYDALRDLYGLEMTSAQESIRPVVLDTRRGRLLELPKGAPAFFVERVSYVEEQPVEVRHSLIRGDRYLYSVRLRVAP